MKRTHFYSALQAVMGLAIVAVIICALFGHRAGLPSLMSELPGTGLTALLPLFAPMLTFLALVWTARRNH